MTGPALASRAFPAWRLPTGVSAFRFAASARPPLHRDTPVMVFVRLAFAAGISSAVLVAMAFVFDVFFFFVFGTAIAARACGPHRVAPLTQPVGQ
jgi:hypothetical protein